jgi:hypothetical protein
MKAVPLLHQLDRRRRTAVPAFGELPQMRLVGVDEGRLRSRAEGRDEDAHPRRPHQQPVVGYECEEGIHKKIVDCRLLIDDCCGIEFEIFNRQSTIIDHQSGVTSSPPSPG